MGARASSGACVAVATFVVLVSAQATAAPPKLQAPGPAPRAANADPDRCASPFDCGALSARLAGKDGDFPAAFRAIRRGCELEKRAFEVDPKNGDDRFACAEYASLLIFAGPARGGDPQRGLSMLEAMCTTDAKACGTLMNEYEHPSRASGLPRQTGKAAALARAACDHGDSSECGRLGDLYLKGGPGLPADPVSARAAMERGCSRAGDKQNAQDANAAAGVCSTLGEKILKGGFGAAPDRKAAIPYLETACKAHYRCTDLLTGALLAEGRADDALRVFDAERAMNDRLGIGDGWAERYCREGYAVMCSRVRKGTP